MRTTTKKRAYVAPRMEVFPIEMEGTILADSSNRNVSMGGTFGTGQGYGSEDLDAPTSPSFAAQARSASKTTVDNVTFD